MMLCQQIIGRYAVHVKNWKLIACMMVWLVALAVPAHAAPPSISSLSPTSGAIGATVYISGSGFGSTQGTSTVKFNGTSATSITSWTATSIAAIVPSGTTTGNVVVTVSGKASNGVTFTVLPTPTITSISPASAPAGETQAPR